MGNLAERSEIKDEKNEYPPLPDHQQEHWCKFPGKVEAPCHKHRIYVDFQANFNLGAPWRFLKLIITRKMILLYLIVLSL